MVIVLSKPCMSNLVIDQAFLIKTRHYISDLMNDSTAILQVLWPVVSFDIRKAAPQDVRGLVVH